MPLATSVQIAFNNRISRISAHIIPGLLLIAISYIGNRPYWCVAIITASLGMNGASTLTNLQNSQDLAPNFAGSLYSIINFVGTSTGFISPMVVGYFTQERVSIASIDSRPEFTGQFSFNLIIYFRTQSTNGITYS